MNVLGRLVGREYLRRRYLGRVRPGPLRDFLSEPFPEPRQPATQARLLAVDFETTGLDPKTDRILSIGCIELAQSKIQLGSAWHQLLSVERAIPAQSAVIHQITDDQASAGASQESAIGELLRRLHGHVMLVHFKRIEQEFMDAACRRLWGAGFVCPMIDTLELGRRMLEMVMHQLRPTDLRLYNLRRRFELPDYQAHSAVNDALATAELYLALRSELDPAARRPLSDFLL